MNDKKIYPLSAVTKAIELTIDKHCSTPTWVKADIVKLNHYPNSGHCYPDLVEKTDNNIVAEIRATIWKWDYERINKKFQEILNENLKDDITIVCLASVKYHPVYGLSLQITDIDPSYTLGELARQKAETIKKLKKENLFDLNKQKHLPVLPKTIAIISVESSKGYKDFLTVMNSRKYDFQFQFLLFPAILQGEKGITTIIDQLQRIKKYSETFEAVAIIRGGGGDTGLSSYDNYKLAKEVASFPIPVLTGIGHSTNETVTELVSFKSFITPTKIAEFLLNRFNEFYNTIIDSEKSLQMNTTRLIEDKKVHLLASSRLFESLSFRIFEWHKSKIREQAHSINNNSKLIIQKNKQGLSNTSELIQYLSIRTIKDKLFEIENLQNKLNTKAAFLLEKEEHELKSLSNRLTLLDPTNVLKRGYSITRLNGKAIKSTSQLNEGDTITTYVFEGELESVITKKEE